MKTTRIKNTIVIVRDFRYFQITEESCKAVIQAEWADQVLGQPSIIFPNGRESHQLAAEILCMAEAVLSAYAVRF